MACYLNIASQRNQTGVLSDESVHLKRFEELILAKEWIAAEVMIKEYFIPNGVDLFPTFQTIWNKLGKENKKNLESLIELVPLNSKIIQKYIWLS